MSAPQSSYPCRYAHEAFKPIIEAFMQIDIDLTSIILNRVEE